MHPLLSAETSREGVPNPARLAERLKLPGVVMKDSFSLTISSGISQIVPLSLGALPVDWAFNSECIESSLVVLASKVKMLSS
jgi:hypothetical protein